MRHKHPELTFARIQHFFTRLCGKIIAETRPLDLEIAGPVDRISWAEAQRLAYKPAAIGQELGPGWSTHWLRLRGEIPAAWRDSTVVVRFSTGSEALLWLDGVPFHGFNHEGQPVFLDRGRAEAVLPQALVESGRLAGEIEIACNGLWGAGPDWRFKLELAELARRDDAAWKMAHDLVILVKWLEEMPEMKYPEPWMGQPTIPPTAKKLPPWPGRVLQLLNRFCNVCDTEDRATWPAGQAILDEIYTHRNATYTHQVIAVGHAHIDTAWLWPLAETKRKCARSFSNALHILDRHRTLRFACSQAQQYAWMKETYPGLYERIRAAARRGQWIPVGGTWVEPDCNLPSGESLVRQFLVGQRFFKQEFGRYCREFWNPDVFGYNGQLPQIMRGAGIEYFLTQKLSWNQFNKPHHQNFHWEGIDGSRVLTHFPPADTYNALDFTNLVRHFHQHERGATDHDRVGLGMMLYGWGDGGGGPSHHMAEILERLEDLQGFPRVSSAAPEEFFERLKAELTEAPVSVGELYFEYHRGTYTTQAANKRDNRRCERQLRDVELLAAVGWHGYPKAELDRLWRLVLLNQFHDILPGSSIRAVYEDSARDYADCFQTLSRLEAAALPVAVGPRGPTGHTLVNTLGWERSGVVELPDQSLVLATVPACGYAPSVARSPVHGPVAVRQEGGEWILENGLLRAAFDAAGHLTSLRTSREAIAPGARANRFALYEDYPHNPTLDAWELDPAHLEKSWDVVAHSVRAIDNGALRAGLEFAYQFGESRMTCRATLAADTSFVEFACTVDWQHRHRFLKVEFPVAVHTPEAAFDIGFGHVRRPTHFNTSYDVARFESPAHFWADLSEEGFGVALLNDSKYGHAVHGNVLRLSLLRGPTHPDPQADLGAHQFRYALYPHDGALAAGEVVRRAHEFNTPWTILPGATSAARSWFSVDTPHLVLDTIKRAEDSDALIVRLHECHGARGTARLGTSVAIQEACRVNLLEEDPEPLATLDAIPFRPFEIITLRLDIRP